MKGRRRGFVVLVDRSNNLAGIATEWDCIPRIVATGENPAVPRLNQVMSSDLVTVGADDGMNFVSEEKAKQGIRRLWYARMERRLAELHPRRF